jgi:hypothetical protein
MKRKLLGSISVVSFCIGIIFFAYTYEYLLFRWSQPIPVTQKTIETKKIITLHYWKEHQWYKESQEIIWSQDQSSNIQRLLNYWLRLLTEHNVIAKHITIQSASFAPNGQDLYISFDRNPMIRQWSIFHKWMFIEGVLRTIRANIDQTCTIFFLLHHQLLSDPHLDFSHPWPIMGYQEASLQ